LKKKLFKRVGIWIALKFLLKINANGMEDVQVPQINPHFFCERTAVSISKLSAELRKVSQ
jgi:hypothetical protein